MNSEQPYSNREIDNFHREIIMRLERIETQTTRTNGRVNRLTLITLAIVCTIVGFGFRELAPLISFLV